MFSTFVDPVVDATGAERETSLYHLVWGPVWRSLPTASHGRCSYIITCPLGQCAPSHRRRAGTSHEVAGMWAGIPYPPVSPPVLSLLIIFVVESCPLLQQPSSASEKLYLQGTPKIPSVACHFPSQKEGRCGVQWTLTQESGHCLLHLPAVYDATLTAYGLVASEGARAYRSEKVG